MAKISKNWILVIGGDGFVHPMLGQNWGIENQNFFGKKVKKMFFRLRNMSLSNDRIKQMNM